MKPNDTESELSQYWILFGSHATSKQDLINIVVRYGVKIDFRKNLIPFPRHIIDIVTITTGNPMKNSNKNITN